MIIEIDASLINKAFNVGVETGFLLATEGKLQELDQQLNLNKIDEPAEDGD